MSDSNIHGMLELYICILWLNGDLNYFVLNVLKCLPLTIRPCPSDPVSFNGSPTPRQSSHNKRRCNWRKYVDLLTLCMK